MVEKAYLQWKAGVGMMRADAEGSFAERLVDRQPMPDDSETREIAEQAAVQERVAVEFPVAR